MLFSLLCDLFFVHFKSETETFDDEIIEKIVLAESYIQRTDSLGGAGEPEPDGTVQIAESATDNTETEVGQKYDEIWKLVFEEKCEIGILIICKYKVNNSFCFLVFEGLH